MSAASGHGAPGRQWRFAMRALAPLLAILAACGACAAPLLKNSPPPGEGSPAIAIYLVSHGWHTGIVVKRADIPEGLWLERRDFPQAEYLEVGWGDREFYRSADPGLWVTLKAAFWPTASVLHVVGFRGPSAEYFRGSEVIELALPRAGFERLVRYVHDAHARDGARAAPLGPGLYGDSRFYPARETFHLFRTCNVWTARALRAAGVPVRDAITMEGLMSQARGLGTVIQPAAP